MRLLAKHLCRVLELKHDDDDDDDENIITAHVINDAAVREHERGNFLLFILTFHVLYISHCEHAADERMRARKFFH